jgi:hypothetical protein
MRNEMALLDARVVELIERLSDEESHANTAGALAAAREIRNALDGDISEDDLKRLKLKANALVRQLTVRDGGEKAWRDIRRTIQDRRKLSESEVKLLVAKHGVIDGATLRVIQSVFLDAIARHVIPLQGGSHAVACISDELRLRLGPIPSEALLASANG